MKRFGELVQLNNLKREIVDELFFDLVEFLPTPSLVEVTKDKLKGYIIKNMRFTRGVILVSIY
ncbi:TPA: hypothetical protein TXN53_000810 [Streptococcus suis]|nr:hypothetical protein [Streptococcus suis]HEP1801364.1 hypothetical protein [Streptococcus suis]